MNPNSILNMNGHATPDEQMLFVNNSNPIGGNSQNNGISSKKNSSVIGSKSDNRGGRRHDPRYLDVIRERPVRVTVKVLVPVKEHPKFNFVGKLLGPKGNSMKRLQEETMTKMAVLGRGSMRDRAKEEELRASGDPKYIHLSEELHVEITSFAAPAESHARIAYALAEVRRYLVPDNNDDIRKEQIREMELISDNSDKTLDGKEGRGASSTSPSPSNVGLSADRPNPPLTPPADIHPSDGVSDCRVPPIVHMRGGRGHPPLPHPRLLHPPPRSLPPLLRKLPPPSLPPPPPAKRRVLSILDKAKLALDQSYGMQDDPYDHHDYMYDDYADYGHEDYPDLYPGEPYEDKKYWSGYRPLLTSSLDRPLRRSAPYSRPK